ncbi:hypothetical protein ACHAW6_001907 [Cyclotella cf. meneghiniana]
MRPALTASSMLTLLVSMATKILRTPIVLAVVPVLSS